MMTRRPGERTQRGMRVYPAGLASNETDVQAWLGLRPDLLPASPVERFGWIQSERFLMAVVVVGILPTKILPVA